MTGYIGDAGVPESGIFRLGPNGQVLTNPEDSKMLCIFYKRAVHNATKSTQAGRLIYDDIDFVKIMQPGERLNIVEREARESDKQRWPQQWAAYAQGKDQVASGTPLGHLFPRHPSAVAMLEALGIMTVEHLANASASAIDAIGIHGQDYVNYAQKYIKTASGGASFHQMQSELDQQKRSNERLTKQLAEVTAQMQALNAAMVAQSTVAQNTALIMQQQQKPEPPAKPDLPPPPNFSGSVLDTQTAQINEHHASAEAVKRRPGRPRKQAENAA